MPRLQFCARGESRHTLMSVSAADKAFRPPIHGYYFLSGFEFQLLLVAFKADIHTANCLFKPVEDIPTNDLGIFPWEVARKNRTKIVFQRVDLEKVGMGG